MRVIKYIGFLPFVLPHLVFYLISTERKKIDKDVMGRLFMFNESSVVIKCINLLSLLVSIKEFRNVFYMRIGSRKQKILNLFLPELSSLSIGINSKSVGGGFIVQHGNSTIVLAKSIGENFFINQNVTVGWTEAGCPTIGSNVRIGTGAVVLGNISIGNNVKIGAGAIVLKNVPDNCTVVSPHAYIVKKDGKKVNLKL